MRTFLLDVMACQVSMAEQGTKRSTPAEPAVPHGVARMVTPGDHGALLDTEERLTAHQELDMPGRRRAHAACWWILPCLRPRR